MVISPPPIPRPFLRPWRIRPQRGCRLHAKAAKTLPQLIGNQPDLEVCGEAGDAFEALEKIGLLKPDLVLSDITLPGKNGLELIKDIHSMHPGVMVLVISMHDEALYVERVLRAGGRG